MTFSIKRRASMALQEALPITSETLLAIGIFLLPALSLTVPTGYSFASIVILLSAIAHQSVSARKYPYRSYLTGSAKLVLLFFILYGAFWIGDAAVRGEGVRAFDRPSRFLLASFCLIAIARTRIQPTGFWMGLSLGSIGAGVIAFWQVFVEGLSRAGGFAQINKFGAIAMLMGLMCVAGLMWAHELSSSRLKRFSALTFLCLGATGGISAGLLSGSRGALFAVIPALLAGAWASRRTGYARGYLLSGLVLGSSVAALAYLISVTGIDSRVISGIQQLHSYMNDNSTQGSIGLRLEMWKGAAQLFTARPLIGWGEVAYVREMHELGQAGLINPETSRFSHAHNDWMNVLAKKGIIGAAILLGTYGLPLLYFIRMARKYLMSTDRDRSFFGLAIAGIIFSSGFMAVGVSQVSFSHNIGVMVYGFTVAVLTGVHEAKNGSYEVRQLTH